MATNKKKPTTRKKTASNTTAARRKATQPAKQLNVSEATIYRTMGIFFVFIALLGLFQWGALGLLVANGFRLLVGEVYALVFAALIASGIYLLIKGKVFDIKLKPMFGGFFVVSAFTTLLHFNQFFGLEPLPQNIFAMTFQIFRNELLMGQMKLSLGGGILGAVYYATFGYLFGQWGTYLVVMILFVAGLGLLLDIPIQAWGQLLVKISHSGRSLVTMLFPSKEPNDAAWTMEAAQDTMEHSVVKQSSRSRSLSERFFGFEEEGNEEEVPTSYSRNESSDSERGQDLQRQRSTRRQWDIDTEADTPILDLDYLAQNDQATTLAERQPVEIVMAQTAFEADTLEAPREDQDDDSLANDDNLANQVVGLPTSSAGHWQAQAHQTSDLTQDELAEQLAANEQTVQPVQIVKPKRKNRQYQLPGKNLLKKIPPVDQSEEYARINENIAKLERTFESFGVQAKVVKANLGPSVTKYEIQPAIGVKVSKIVSLSDDIALALAARDVRMEAPIPGKSLIGIEVPNTQVSPVSFWEIIDAALESPHILEVPLGRDISGTVCLADLSKMPHLLIAGATGAGKSVGMNVIIVSLLMKAKPDEVKFLMIDPKKVELTMYDGVPHLLAPVVTNPRKAAQALNKVVQEMERRYELFAATGVRNIDGYNENVDQYNAENGTGYERMPKIVVFIDELADLMMVASNDVENAIIRLAQMARAAGIHMIIATQRPSVDVITGIIKANVPSRLAFAVSSSIDSRTILDSNGAEKLLGRGDMLFQPMGKNKPVRVQGAYISDSEVDKITQFVKGQQEAEYDESMMIADDEATSGAAASDDEYFGEAIELLKGLETVSISQLQRKFRIGYNRAARLIDDLEAQGYVGPQDGSKPRQVFVNE